MTDLDTPPSFAPEEPICVVSPHLDDAALSCSHFIAAYLGIHVATVFTDGPDEDRAGGYNEIRTGQDNAREAHAVRKGEDAQAMALLGAAPHWLNLWESEYNGEAQPLPPIISAVSSIISEQAIRSVIAPLGLEHSDHRAVDEAVLGMTRHTVSTCISTRRCPTQTQVLASCPSASLTSQSVSTSREHGGDFGPVHGVPAGPVEVDAEPTREGPARRHRWFEEPLGFGAEQFYLHAGRNRTPQRDPTVAAMVVVVVAQRPLVANEETSGAVAESLAHMR
jgi:LmbE family N-acetylglucosaminyl deacetylase